VRANRKRPVAAEYDGFITVGERDGPVLAQPAVHHVFWPDVRGDHAHEGLNRHDDTYFAADLLAEPVKVFTGQVRRH
jgi:hypothetical protein